MDQAFETKRTTWEREYKASTPFRDFCDTTFKKKVLKLSRSDLFKAAETDFHSGLFSIILWGYPRNMRGSIFLKILEEKRLAAIKLLIQKGKELSEKDFAILCQELNGTGIGLSTLTKILYFFNFKIGRLRCLIFDRRIIDVINEGLFSEVSALSKINEYNKRTKYVDYLSKMEELAEASAYKPDQLELFLFQFGKNLKQEK